MTDYLDDAQREAYDARMKNIYKEFGDWASDFTPPLDAGVLNLMRMSWAESQQRQERRISELVADIAENDAVIDSLRDLLEDANGYVAAYAKDPVDGYLADDQACPY